MPPKRRTDAAQTPPRSDAASATELFDLSQENKRIAKMYADAGYDLNDLFDG